MNPEKLNGDEILVITTPEKLFDKNKIKMQFMKLRKRWHPDYCSLPNAGDVFHHIQTLKEKADELFASGMWNGDNGEIEFTILPDGKHYVFRYESVRAIDVGKMYVGKEKVLFMVKEEFSDLYKNAKHAIDAFPFVNSKIAKEFGQFFPNSTFIGKTSNEFVMMIKKPKDVYCLADIIDYYEGEVHQKHVAWIGSGLFNLSAMMQVSGMIHNGLTADAIFIRPSDHSVYLYGGWWYSAKIGRKLSAIPSKMARVLPNQFFVDKEASSCYDGSQIKATLIEALGDKTMLGSSLLKGSDVSKPLLSWLRSSDKQTAIDRYSSWYKILEKAFGKRRFTKMEIDTTKIYRR